MIYGAMATQLDRVNAANAHERITELEQDVARLQSLLQTARERIAKQNAELETLRAAAAPQPVPQAKHKDRPAPNLTYKGRAATTAMQAAAYYGVHLSTVIRRLQNGKIAGEQLPGSNRWIVFLDCPIPAFQKKKGSTK
jgi:Tfp pilus assembly protein FimV